MILTAEESHLNSFQFWAPAALSPRFYFIDYYIFGFHHQHYKFYISLTWFSEAHLFPSMMMSHDDNYYIIYGDIHDTSMPGISAFSSWWRRYLSQPSIRWCCYFHFISSSISRAPYSLCSMVIAYLKHHCYYTHSSKYSILASWY